MPIKSLVRCLVELDRSDAARVVLTDFLTTTKLPDGHKHVREVKAQLEGLDKD